MRVHDDGCGQTSWLHDQHFQVTVGNSSLCHPPSGIFFDTIVLFLMLLILSKYLCRSGLVTEKIASEIGRVY